MGVNNYVDVFFVMSTCVFHVDSRQNPVVKTPRAFSSLLLHELQQQEFECFMKGSLLSCLQRQDLRVNSMHPIWLFDIPEIRVAQCFQIRYLYVCVY